MPETGALTWCHLCTPAFHSLFITLPNTWKPPENSPPALGAPEHEAYSCISALRGTGAGPEQAEKSSKQCGCCICPTKPHGYGALPSPFAFVWLLGAFPQAHSKPKASSCLLYLIRCEQ